MNGVTVGTYASYLVLVDFEGLQKALTGRLGWMPRDFWASRLYDCRVALEGMEDGDMGRLHMYAVQAAWIINNARNAVWEDNFRGVSPDDLFDPDRKRLTKEEADEYRSELKERIDETKPPGYFSGGPDGSSPRGKPPGFDRVREQDSPQNDTGP